MSSRDRWKRQERETAAILGGERQPCTGGPHADVLFPGFVVECKTRKELPAWLTGGIRQAEAQATQGETAAVVLTEVRQGVKAKRYVLMRLEDFADWHGGRIP